MVRWKRIRELSEFEMHKLKKITNTTQGMVLYGNKARVAVMLPLDLAERLSKESKNKDKTICHLIIEKLNEVYKK